MQRGDDGGNLFLRNFSLVRSFVFVEIKILGFILDFVSRVPSHELTGSSSETIRHCFLLIVSALQR